MGWPCSETVNLRRNPVDENVTLVRDWIPVTSLVYRCGTSVAYLAKMIKYPCCISNPRALGVQDGVNA